MVVTCEVCNAKFRLNPERLKGPASKVRCSRCGYVFTPVREEEPVQVDLADESELPTTRMTAPASTSPPATTQPSEAKERRPFPRWLGWVALVLVVGLAGLGIMNYMTGPQSDDKAATGQPETPQVKVLDTTQAFFLENAHAGQIFVVEGEVENQSTKPISFILVEGKLYNTSNRVAITQKCFAGNAMTRDELGRLMMAEVQNRMMNREGKDRSNTSVPSGKRIPFMLIFHNLPELKALSDYSVEVVSSKFD